MLTTQCRNYFIALHGSSGTWEQWHEGKKPMKNEYFKDSLQSRSKIKNHPRNFNVSPQGMESKLPLAGFPLLDRRDADAQSNQDISCERRSSVACGKSKLVPSN